jgi:hypothetical protein
MSPETTGPTSARRSTRFLATFLVACAVGSAACNVVPPPGGGGGGTPTFTRHVIDGRDLGADVKAVGDIDGDGDLDVVVGDDETAYLQWYAAPDWTLEIIDARTVFTTDMELADIDRDGDLDVVVPDYPAGTMLWYANPRIGGGSWRSQLIGTSGAHDVEVGDVDRDGDVDVAVRAHHGSTVLFRQDPSVRWTRVTLPVHGGEGLALGDLDRDGDLDVGQNGWWLQTPADLVFGTWTQYTIDGGWPDLVATDIADVNADGRNDLLVAPSESTGQIVWYQAPANPGGTWIPRVVGPADFVHDFGVADVDLDGDRDIVFAEMHQSAQRRVGWFRNDGSGTSWAVQVVATTGSHNIRVADMDRDGDIDIMGSNWGGSPSPIEWWENGIR